jgi:hypothetical protein
MAITRSQIARQLLAEGGAPRSPGNTTLQRVLPRMDGLRPGFYGPDAGEGGMESSFGADTYSDGGDNPIDSGEAAGGTRQQFAATAEALGTPQTPGLRENFMANQLRKQLDLMAGNTRLSPSFFANMFGGPAVNVYDKDFLGANQEMEDVVGLDQYGMSGKNLTRSQNIQEALDEFQETGRLSQDRFNEVFGSNVPTRTPGGDNQVMARKPMIPKLPTDIEPEESDYAEFVQRFTLPERFRLAEGGEPRQAYGLGKLVKKVTGAVKKVAKSDIGKAALVGAGVYGLGGGTFFGKTLPGIGTTGGFGFGNIPLNLFGQSVAGGAVPGSQFEGLLSKIGLSGGYGGGLTFPGGGIGAGIAGLSAAAYALTPKQEEEVDSLSSRIADNTGIDVEQIRKEVQEAYASGNTEKLRTKYPFLITESAAKADGGRIGFENGGTYEDFEKFMMKRQESMSERQKEELRKQFENYMRSQDPTVEAAEGGSIVPEEDEMLNMGGNEMDLRGGGFVPLGEYEKKDDVPARLSKNEFVFTADAVRAAGGGSVDRGADLMYKTMKQLENKVV